MRDPAQRAANGIQGFAAAPAAPQFRLLSQRQTRATSSHHETSSSGSCCIDPLNAPTKPNDSIQGSNDYIDWKYGWPVVVDDKGLVLMQLRSLWSYEIDNGVRFATNAEWRTYLQNNPEYRKLFALSLDDGSQPFLTVVMNSGFNNSGYSPMGPQPVVRSWANADTVAYTTTYNSTANGPCTDSTDRQCGAAFAELMLDSNTVPGYKAGDVRLIRADVGTATLQTDEHGPMSMLGDMLFYGHWAFASGHRIVGRSDSRGMPYAEAITTGNGGQPDVVFLTEANYSPGCSHDASAHYCSGNVGFEGGGRYFFDGAFYVYFDTKRVYDQYWTGGVFVTASNNQVYFRSNDGSILVVRP